MGVGFRNRPGILIPRVRWPFFPFMIVVLMLNPMLVVSAVIVMMLVLNLNDHALRQRSHQDKHRQRTPQRGAQRAMAYSRSHPSQATAPETLCQDPCRQRPVANPPPRTLS